MPTAKFNNDMCGLLSSEGPFRPHAITASLTKDGVTFWNYHAGQGGHGTTVPAVSALKIV